ncbi:nicotinamide N-methylase [Kaistia algarum]|uniref:class I SAM-dependent methyltransferase n=1 Tax=Kaistia algarum TaxID=2083279 RepID=UPI000CE7B964|nr:50S ribosomal protein L11 methyltransferase [Kaistia algarum]MCX5514130.1 50S ribosomal protein L11 methyltransferase [Kaistia algarum]PPE77898.1 nicotinamide N-methylase [Kaistia algarum]
MGDRVRNGGNRALSDRDPARFIRNETRLLPVPFIPEIRIHQADEVTALWHSTERELDQAGLQPPFWAFAWAGGRGLCRYILDHTETVAGKRVLDFASGSGLVAIAAALAGARAVEAVDIDPFAAIAIRLNAEANGVVVRDKDGDRIGSPIDAEILLAGDIFYDRGFAERVLPWLREIAASCRVLVGDPGRHYRPVQGMLEIARYDVPVEAALEDGSFKSVSILEILPVPANAFSADFRPCDSASVR